MNHDDNSDYNDCIQLLESASQEQFLENELADGQEFEDTCNWFLERVEFKKWTAAEGPPLLLLIGVAGMGKTTLCRFLRSKLSRSNWTGKVRGTVALFCCDYHQRRSTPAAVVAGLLAQLLRKNKQQFIHIRDEYHRIKDALSNNFPKLRMLFLQFLAHVPGQVYLIIDAIDECKEDIEELLRLVRTSVKIERPGQTEGTTPIKVLLSSRSENELAMVRRIPSQKVYKRDISNELSKSVALFIEHQVQDLGLSVVKDNIYEEINKKAGGTYLWAALMLKELGTVRNLNRDVHRKEMDAQFKHFPRRLNQIYDRMLAEISPSRVSNAKFILSLLAIARRPLKRAELALFYLVHLTTGAMNNGDFVDKEELDNLAGLYENCEHLVDLRNETVSLVHTSLQEYLLSNRLTQIYLTGNCLTTERVSCLFQFLVWGRFWRYIQSILGGLGLLRGISQFHVNPKTTHLTIFQLCWKSLCASPLEEGRLLIECNDKSELSPHPECGALLKSHQELSYAANEWLEHATSAGEELLAPTQDLWFKEYLDRLPTLRDRWLHEVVRMEDMNMARKLLVHDANATCSWGKYGSILHRPAHKGNTALVDLLIRHGADVNAKGRLFDNPLHAAAHNNHIDVIKLLLKHGASINYPDDERCLALQAAASNGHTETVRLLLEKKAYVNSYGGNYSRPLQAAACNKHVGIVQLLLESGADPNAKGQGHAYALQAASWSGSLEIVKLLVQRGAQVNAWGGEYGSALDAAIKKNNNEIEEFLRKNGAKESTEEDLGAGLIYLATLQGDATRVQRLIDEGEDVNHQGGRYGNALQAAAVYDRFDIAQILLKSDADIHARGGCYSNALHAAIMKGSSRIVKLLLDSNVDVNMPGESLGSFLHSAAVHQDLDVLQLLLDHGANPNAQGGRYGNALQAAACSDDDSMVTLLLSRGASPTAQGGIFGTALQAAAMSGNTKSVIKLLEYGADPNARGGQYGYALLAAVKSQHKRSAQALLERGADVNVLDDRIGSALHIAADVGDKSPVGLLWKYGARADVKDVKGRTAIDLATARGHVELGKLLTRGHPLRSKKDPTGARRQTKIGFFYNLWRITQFYR